jgi:hypothetical protein
VQNLGGKLKFIGKQYKSNAELIDLLNSQSLCLPAGKAGNLDQPIVKPV